MQRTTSKLSFGDSVTYPNYLTNYYYVGYFRNNIFKNYIYQGKDGLTV
jgi:hypothetical protein